MFFYFKVNIYELFLLQHPLDNLQLISIYPNIVLSQVVLVVRNLDYVLQLQFVQDEELEVGLKV